MKCLHRPSRELEPDLSHPVSPKRLAALVFATSPTSFHLHAASFGVTFDHDIGWRHSSCAQLQGAPSARSGLYHHSYVQEEKPTRHQHQGMALQSPTKTRHMENRGLACRCVWVCVKAVLKKVQTDSKNSHYTPFLLLRLALLYPLQRCTTTAKQELDYVTSTVSKET